MLCAHPLSRTELCADMGEMPSAEGEYKFN